MLSQEQILAKLRSFKVEEVKIPEWKEDEDGEAPSLFIRSLTGLQREELENLASKANTVSNLRALMFVYSVCDEKGNLLFKKSDMGALNEGQAAVLTRVFFAASKFNKMRPEDLEDIQKN